MQKTTPAATAAPNLTSCRDCGEPLPLDVTQEYQVCALCQEIELTDEAMSQGEK